MVFHVNRRILDSNCHITLEPVPTANGMELKHIDIVYGNRNIFKRFVVDLDFFCLSGNSYFIIGCAAFHCDRKCMACFERFFLRTIDSKWCTGETHHKSIFFCDSHWSLYDHKIIRLTPPDSFLWQNIGNPLSNLIYRNIERKLCRIGCVSITIDLRIRYIAICSKIISFYGTCIQLRFDILSISLRIVHQCHPVIVIALCVRWFNYYRQSIFIL